MVGSWADKVDRVKSVTQVKVVTTSIVVKHVGPITNNCQAAEKVADFMAENECTMVGWKWNGHWNTENGTSFAEFERTETIVNGELAEK